MAGVTLTPSPFIPVSGVIDGKFEGGYLITVKIGSEDFKGVLYQVPQSEEHKVCQHHSVPTDNMNSPSKPGIPHRNRRKKCEIRRRDPAHPKPNRSGYNFFFAEQHSRLKPLYPGRDRDISKMIGELWNKLKETEKSVYQEKALRDKERYRLEMEDYRKRLRTGQLINNVAPIQPFPLISDAGLLVLDKNVQTEGESYAEMTGIKTSPDKSKMERNDKADDSEMEGSFQAEMELKNVNIEILQSEDVSDLQTGQEVLGCEDNSPGHGQIIKNAAPTVQFPPMAESSLMDVDKFVRTEGDTSVYMAENETSSNKRKLEVYEKACDNSGVGASFQAEIEAAYELQTGQDMVGCEDINNAVQRHQFAPLADSGLMDLDKNFHTEDDTSTYMAETETSSINCNLGSYEKTVEDSGLGESLRETELKNVNVKISLNEETSFLQTGRDVVRCEDISNAVPVQQFPSELQTGQGVIGCEDINNAVPMQPLAESGLMALRRNVQTEGDASHVTENPNQSNLGGHEKQGNDSGIDASFQAEKELENLIIKSSLKEDASEVQMGPDAIRCNDNNPGYGELEEKKMLSSGGGESSVSVEGEMSVEEEEDGSINVDEPVAITKGHESP